MARMGARRIVGDGVAERFQLFDRVVALGQLGLQLLVGQSQCLGCASPDSLA